MQQVRDYKRITVKPIGGAIGAEVEGTDLTRLDDDTFAEIAQAFADHSVLAFRNQKLTPQDIEAFGSRFGQLSITSYVPPLPGTRYIQHFLREASAKWGERNFGDNWHADQTIREQPNIIAGLYSVESPSQGGDTMFTSLAAAYDTLSPKLQEICEQLTLMHSASGLYGPDGQGGRGVKKAIDRPKFTLTDEQLRDHLAKETPHPLIVQHPVSGRKLLFISGPYAVRFDGMTEDESQPLIQYLYQHAQRPEFAMRWRWNPGELVMWDNFACMHFGVQDYAGLRREMWRFEVEGSTPMAPGAARPASMRAAE